MAASKKSPSSSKTRSSSSQLTLKRVKGENFYRNAKQAARVKMLNGGKPVYGRDGKIVQAAAFQKGEDETKPGRVQPDRRWFGNTRVISQQALDHFRTSLSTKQNDPYSVLLRRNKLPMALLDDAKNPNARKRSHIVETEPFHDTFGPKAQRKRPRLDVGTFEELGKAGAAAADSVDPSTIEVPEEPMIETTHADYIEPIYAKGTSRRIYGELYKVIDSSDVILHILDARDPIGTMCHSVLEYIKKEKAHKQVVLIINKCDLVPSWVTARYIQHLTPQYPTLAFHASPNHSFGKGSLIQLLRQFSQLHSDKKQISVGFVGYPNVGKSSVINTLKSGKVCRVAPVPGETKVWQYITLTRRIYLIDCPGIVPTSAHDTHTSTVLKGVVRVEAVPSPAEHIPALLARVRPLYLSRTYGVPLPKTNSRPPPAEEGAGGSPSKTETQSDAARVGGWDAEEFLDKLARMKGRLLKGGEPDLDGVARIILGDWVRGRIPYFVPPPERPEELNEREARAREKAEKKKSARAKGKERAPDWEEGAHAIGVTQKLGGIIQKNTFVPEDVRPLEEIVGEEEAGEDNVSGDEDEDEDEDEEGSEEGVNPALELSWADVFQDTSLQSKPEAASAVDSDDDDASSDESEEEGKPKKEPRMTTNKRKASNFFTSANVKNKNRSKAKLMKTLQSQQTKRRASKK